MEKQNKRRGLIGTGAFMFSLLGGWLFLNRKESTSKLAHFHGRNIADFVHSYLYFRWTSKYLRPVKYVLEHPERFPAWLYMRAGNRLMQTHHSKVLTPETAKRLVDVKEPIMVRNTEQVLPFEQARDIILKSSEHIAVTDCPCRQVAENPCQPLDVCFVLGEPFVDFVVEHKKGNARRIATSEALAILQREHERGRVHTAWFKDAAGDRLYSICNCCSCCCLGLRALSLGFGVVASSGYAAEVDGESCTLCGACAEACQFDAVTVGVADSLESTGSAGADVALVDAGMCKGCGVCIETCPAGAISLKADPSKPSPLVLP